MAKSKKNSWVAWSEDEVKLLKRLFPRGRAREIAEQTGRSLTAVRLASLNILYLENFHANGVVSGYGG